MVAEMLMRGRSCAQRPCRRAVLIRSIETAGAAWICELPGWLETSTGQLQRLLNVLNVSIVREEDGDVVVAEIQPGLNAGTDWTESLKEEGDSKRDGLVGARCKMDHQM